MFVILYSCDFNSNQGDYIITNYRQDVVLDFIIYIWFVFKLITFITFVTFQELWRYSNITCSLYPLLALDSIGPTGDTSTLISTIYTLTNANNCVWWKSNFIFLFSIELHYHNQILKKNYFQRNVKKYVCLQNHYQFMTLVFRRELHLVMINLLNV